MTPVSNLEGKIAATNVLEGNHVKPDYSGIPSVVFPFRRYPVWA